MTKNGEKPAYVMLLILVIFISLLQCYGANSENWNPELQTGHTPHFNEWDGKFPNTCQEYTIKKIASGIFRMKYRPEKGVYYYECGKRYNKKEAKKNAYGWAYFIVLTSWENDLPAWPVAALIANESRFDNCAFGLNPRKAAYKFQIIEPNKYTTSHSFEEVFSAISSNKMRKNFKTFDLGCMQLLEQYSLVDDVGFLMTWAGCAFQIRTLAKYKRNYGTDKPWAFWPGIYSEWKHEKVMKYVKRLKRASL